MTTTPHEPKRAATPTGWVRCLAVSALIGAGLVGGVACTPTDRGDVAPASPAASEASTGAIDASSAASAPEETYAGPSVLGKLPHVSRHGEDRLGEYISITSKQTYAISGEGLALLGAADGEALVEHDVEGDAAYTCTEKGAAWNQSTLWFPMTGLFVQGGKLDRVRQGNGETREVQSLRTTWFAESKLFYTEGDKAFTFAPCVGPQLVKQGAYTEAFLKPGDVLRVAVPGQKQALELALPAENRPHGALEFANGQHAIAPMRIVLATVDVPRKRLVLQYQLTFPAQPVVREVALGATESEEQMRDAVDAADETVPKALAHRQQTQRMLDAHLAKCTAPTSPIVDVCTQPSNALRALHKRLKLLVE